jgi:hypothetical protein
MLCDTYYKSEGEGHTLGDMLELREQDEQAVLGDMMSEGT